MGEILWSLFKPEISVPTLVTLIGIFIALEARIIGKLEKVPKYRTLVADALSRNVWLEIYVYRLDQALRWLNHWMGPIDTCSGLLRNLNVCLAVSAGYAALSFILGWMLGGPGSVGETQFLPTLQGIAQCGWGIALLTLAGIVGFGLI